MQCNCGGETLYSTHQVKTLPKIIEWLGRDHPRSIIVGQEKCSVCGRLEKKIFDAITLQRL